LSTITAQVTPQGISAPAYADVFAQMQNWIEGIYGSDIVISADSQDGQFIAIFAQAVSDLNDLAVNLYGSFRPTSAQGAALASLVKINGLTKQSGTNSTCPVTVSGNIGAQIIGGVVGDNQGLNTRWDLPALVTIPVSGSIIVTATCESAGATPAGANTLTVILTPTYGWTGVTNGANTAAPGAPVETDFVLRQRQAQSTALPANSVLAGIFSALGQISGVTRVALYENFTDSVDFRGIPDHSISCVLLGGNAQAIANTISLKKTPGTGTYGTISEQTVDQNGVPATINFYAMVLILVSITVNLKAHAGYTTAVGANIQAAVAQFINNLATGGYVYNGALYAPADLSGDAATLATGLTQQQLDLQSVTYTIQSITASRAVNVPDTVVTGGPYAAASAAIAVSSVLDFYVNQTIAFVMDNAALFTTTISSVVGNTLNLTSGVPAGRSVPNSANVFLVSDVLIRFYEAAIGAVTNVTVNAN
jgi:hypothetical protein